MGVCILLASYSLWSLVAIVSAPYVSQRAGPWFLELHGKRRRDEIKHGGPHIAPQALIYPRPLG
eukprot:scaffold1837_cov391-Prasinococcus_capsulatus_cf.AAC.3